MADKSISATIFTSLSKGYQEEDMQGNIAFHPGEIPALPGVYIFRDRFGTVIYVGKAANLRKRLSSYFQPSKQIRAEPKLRSLINSIASWEYQSVKNEDESLLLESQLIKQYAPHYNVLMRDDKRFLQVKINLNAPFPRLELARLRKDDGCRYFGPFPHGYALKATIEFLSVYFKLRSCRTPVPDANDRKHCLYHKHCTEPCLGKVTSEEYRKQVERMQQVLGGSINPLLDELRQQMQELAAARKFEQAASFRDVMANLQAIFGISTRRFINASLKSAAGDEALNDLALALGTDRLPERIEGFDISNLGGTMAVGSMVCFIDGKADRAKYRRFRIKTVHQSDDFAMMREMFLRHFSRKLQEQQSLPDLIMVDGGKGQLSAAISALNEISYPPAAIIGLAKKNEEIYLPDCSDPLVLERFRPALKLLQAVRDEAHRFAVNYHRQLRNRRISESLLDEIPGIGETRKKLLLENFGSVRALRQASAGDICTKVPGIGNILAQTIVKILNQKVTGNKIC
jgi:excinuclease ABC subunit C